MHLQDPTEPADLNDGHVACGCVAAMFVFATLIFFAFYFREGGM